MIGKSLPKAVGYGHDLAARENMLLASCMAGMAFSSAGLGLCHAMAHQRERRCIFRTAEANAMLLPTVMGFNRMVCRERFSQIGRALTNKKSDDRDAIAAVSELIAEVGQSKRLADAGAKPEHYSAWAQAALEDICLRSNTHRHTGTDYRPVRGCRVMPVGRIRCSHRHPAITRR